MDRDGWVATKISIAVGTTIVVLAVFVFSSYGHAIRLLVTGHSGCSLLDTLAAVRVMNQQTSMRDHMALALLERDGKREKWQTPLGPFWVPAGDKASLRDAIAEELASDVHRVQAGDVRAGDTILDCGANVGTFTRVCLNRGARLVLVVAIEPAPDTVECLVRTFAAEIKAGKVIVYGKGVWDRDDSLRLQVVPNLSEGNTFVLHPELKDGPVVPLTTVDKIVSELNLQNVDLIKMDIEAAEQRALRGAARTIKRFRPRLAISAHHLRDDPVMVPRIVHGLLDYRQELGYCQTIWNGDIMPGVLHFYPRN